MSIGENFNLKQFEIITPTPLPLCGVLIDQRHHYSGYKTIPHSHNHISIIYAISGEGHFIKNGIEYLMSSDTVLIIDKNQEHQMIDSPNQPMVVYVVRISKDIANSHRKLIDPLMIDEAPIIIPHYYAFQLRRLLRQMLHEQNNRQEKYELALQQYLVFFILFLYRLRRRKKSSTDSLDTKNSLNRVSAVLSLVEQNYFESYCLSDVAQLARLSQRQFTNLCQKNTGMSFFGYITNIRITKAKELMEKTNLSITAIAFEVGYEEFTTFYRAFKKRYKCSPNTYRKQLSSNLIANINE